MKSAEEIMEILEAYDLTGSLRDAAELAGCSHHTVAQYVAARERGGLTPGRAQRREMLVDPYLAEAGGVGRALAWQGPRGCGAREADRVGLLGFGAHHPAGGGGGQGRRIGRGGGGCIGRGSLL